jgi:hypothetical protein
MFFQLHRSSFDFAASALTGIDPHLLMRIDPPELCSGFDLSLFY